MLYRSFETDITTWALGRRPTKSSCKYNDGKKDCTEATVSGSNQGSPNAGTTDGGRVHWWNNSKDILVPLRVILLLVVHYSMLILTYFFLLIKLIYFYFFRSRITGDEFCWTSSWLNGSKNYWRRICGYYFYYYWSIIKEIYIMLYYLRNNEQQKMST